MNCELPLSLRVSEQRPDSELYDSQLSRLNECRATAAPSCGSMLEATLNGSFVELVVVGFLCNILGKSLGAFHLGLPGVKYKAL